MSSLLRGRSFITTQEFSKSELDLMLDLSSDLKRRFAVGEPTPWLNLKTLFMIFFDESTRTRNSVEAGMTQLGGHAHFLNPKVMQTAHGEVARDTAMILSRYGHGIAVRHCAYKIGNAYLGALEKYSDTPILNLQDDYYHPMQVLADIMTIREVYGNNTKGLKVGISWAYAESHLKPLSVPQSQILLFPRYGLDVTLAYPKGFDLMPEMVETAKKNAEKNGSKFEISHDMDEAFKDADIVIPKSWGGFFVSEDENEIMSEVRKNKDWICTPDKMKLANKNSVYMHALPADRGREVVDEVIDGEQSVVIDEAENRLHTAKAVMALTMGGRP
ncbi:MAG: ornithine carbamoyltransferase [Kosmotogaceae bacterium]